MTPCISTDDVAGYRCRMTTVLSVELVFDTRAIFRPLVTYVCLSICPITKSSVDLELVFDTRAIFSTPVFGVIVTCACLRVFPS